MVRAFLKSANQPNKMALTIYYSMYCNCFRLMRDWKKENLANFKDISAFSFRTEKEDYLKRQSIIFLKITVPFDFNRNFRISLFRDSVSTLNVQ